MKNLHNFISLLNNLMYLVCDLHKRNAVFFLVTTTVICRKEVIKLQWGWTPFYMY